MDEKKNAMIKPTVETVTKKLARAALRVDEIKRSATATIPVSANKEAKATCTQKLQLKRQKIARRLSVF